MAATMPEFLEMEQRHGSLIRAARKTKNKNQADRQASGARYGLFVAPRDGMSSLIDAIANRLPSGSIRLGSAVLQISRSDNHKGDGSWRLSVASSTKNGSAADEIFDSVILATAASKAAPLLNNIDSRLSADVAAIPHAGTSVVVAAYRLDQFTRRPDCFGIVAPMVENRKILAISFASMKFAGRAPQGTVLVRTFIGGACQGELAELPDDDLIAIAQEELGELLGLSGQPLFHKVVRWLGAMPQYHIGHLQKVEQIEKRVAGLENFELAGNAFRGVGIPFCIRDGEQAAERIAVGMKNVIATRLPTARGKTIKSYGV